MKTLKITACFLLLFQALHLASLQTTTDSPGRTIDKSWLRKPFINPGENGNPEQSEFNSGLETSGFGNDNSGGIPSGFMAENTEEEQNVANQFRGENGTSEDVNISNNTLHSAFENETNKQAELPQAAIPPANASTESTNSSQTNMTEAEEEFGSTMAAENSTNTRDLSNNTALESTTLAPETGTTKQPTTTLDSDKRLANLTGSTSTAAPTTVAPNTAGSTTAAPTTAAPTTAGPTTTTPQINKTTTANPFEIPESSLATTTDMVNVPNEANRSGVVPDGSERGTGAQSGLESDLYRSKRNVAWMAVLGTAAATACVGVVAYIIIKKKNQKAFTHRKLVEEYPADPVLRLDNCEPLDLNFSGAAYNNPGLQGDHIQMDSISARR